MFTKTHLGGFWKTMHWRDFFPETDDRRGWFLVHLESQKNWTAYQRKKFDDDNMKEA